MQYIDTMSLRSKASRFGAASNEMKRHADRVSDIDASLTADGAGWKGVGSLGFLIRSEKHRDDLVIASKAFYQVAQALISLAGQFEQVNQLRREAEQLRHQIESLHDDLRFADDPARQASIRERIHSLNYRKRNTENYADQLEQRADQNAANQFNDIADMCDRLRAPDDVKFDIDGTAPFTGISKHLGNAGAGMDAASTVKKGAQGFQVHRVKTKKGYYARVTNGHFENIKGKKFYWTNAKQTGHILKYIDPKVGAAHSLKDIKSFGAKLGYLGVVWETIDHLVENVQDDKKWSYTTSEAVVDVGLGLAGIAAAAYAAGLTGAAFGTVGGPAGIILGAIAGVSASVFCSLLTDGVKIQGKPINEHLKEGLSSTLDGVGNFASSAWGSVSSIFDDEE